MPTKRQIIDGILKEDKDLVTEGGSGSAGRKSVSVKDQMNEVIHTRSQAWKVLFKVGGFFDNNIDEPIEQSDLLDPLNPITSTILYLYSLETFIPELLNKASREKDYSKVKTLYPFARVLYQIVSVTNANRDDAIHGEIVTWRGTKLSKQLIEDYKQKALLKSTISLMGFTTVTTSKEFAKQFAFSDAYGLKSGETPRYIHKPRKSSVNVSHITADTEPVVFRIILNNVYDHFEMNTFDFNAYTNMENEEILLQDGSQFKVDSIGIMKNCESKCFQINLEYISPSLRK